MVNVQSEEEPMEEVSKIYSALFHRGSNDRSAQSCAGESQAEEIRRYRHVLIDPVEKSRIEPQLSSRPFSSCSTSVEDSADDCDLANSNMSARRFQPSSAIDFLTIPPPPRHSPDSSPTDDVLRRPLPLPPQREMPPAPPISQPTTSGDEPQYEEATPLVAPMRLTQLQQINRAGFAPDLETQRPYESSNQLLMGLSSFGSAHRHKPAGYDPNWNHFETSVLERNANGSFFIPSGTNTTVSRSVSPTKREEKHKNSYSLLPSAQTTVPTPVLPFRPEVELRSGHQPMLKSKRSGGGWLSDRCSWRCAAYTLAFALIFALAVVAYLVVNLLALSDVSQVPVELSRDESISDPTILNGAPLRRKVDRQFPGSFALGDEVVADLDLGFTRSSFVVQKDAQVTFNLSVEPQAKLGFFLRQTLPPTATESDFPPQIVLGAKLHSTTGKRAVPPYGYQLLRHFRAKVFGHFLVAGRWHVGLLNDGDEVTSVRFITSLSDTDSSTDPDCKYDCYGKGVCREGKCVCVDGYSGQFCEETVCPALCSGNGIYTSGRCHCHQGWKGVECDVASNVCEVPDCNGRGQCVGGDCQCDQGYRGTFCQEADCPDPTCSGRGVCLRGFCYCEFGWRGDSCQIAYTSAGICPSGQHTVEPVCSGHGQMDSDSDVCQCEEGWDGAECDREVCRTDCGPNGRCDTGGICVCSEGWTGPQCRSPACLPGCDDNGRCVNGSCLCNDGWNGEICQLAGCPNKCGRRGDCRKVASRWLCHCSPDFTGDDCGVPLELNCADGIDNDGDGLVDCQDSECCLAPRCESDSLCQTVLDPQAVLISRQAPAPSASFHQKMKFLVEPDSVQQYPDLSLFNESRTSVIRGRVVSEWGGVLVGVRVTDTSAALIGFTISRAGGLFDLMVNGGGVVTLQFMRVPFGSVYKTAPTAWNQVVWLGDVVMQKDRKNLPVEPLFPTIPADCQRLHDPNKVFPHVMSSWEMSRSAGPVGHDAILAESQAVQSSLSIPGTQVHLVYNSARAVGYESSLQLHLIPSALPRRLRLVHVDLEVEGIHYGVVLEATADLSHQWGWDKRNVYRQKVYGLTSVKVSVGYVYTDCSFIFWTRQVVKMAGYTQPISDLGGWNLDVHHHYDIHGGVLQKGDGTTVYLRQEPPNLRSTVGSRQQRQLSCSPCNEPADRASLHLPMALASGKDGSLFLGDYNLVRRLTPDNQLQTVLELSPADVEHRYHLAVHPATGELLISLPLRRQIWRIRNAYGQPPTPSSNHEILAGTGQSCLPAESCGDGGPATMARLTFPKGIAVNSRGVVFVADGRKIRVIDANGIITTLVGHSGTQWRPQICVDSMGMSEAQLQWPTAVAVSPLDDSLLVADDSVLYVISSGDKIRIAAGSPSHCSQLETETNSTVRPVPLVGIQAVTVGLDGRVFVAESDGRRLNRIRSVSLVTGAVELVAGVESQCDCGRNCPCDDANEVSALSAHLHLPVGLAVTPDGRLHLADQGNLQLRTLVSAEPKMEANRRHLEISSPDGLEVFGFNRFGKHIWTRSILSDRLLFNFSYHIDTNWGKLVSVTGADQSRLLITRKSAAQLHLETPGGRRVELQLDLNGLLDRFAIPDGPHTDLSYDPNGSGLLAAKTDSVGQTTFFRYDSSGRLRQFVTPTGELGQLHSSLQRDQLRVEVRLNDVVTSRFNISSTLISRTSGGQTHSTFIQAGMNFLVKPSDGSTVQYDFGPQPLLESHQTTVLRRKLTLPESDSPPRKELSCKLEWRHFLRRSAKGTGSKRIAQVNGANVLTLEFDREKNVDVVYNQPNEAILTVEYDSAGLPVRWVPMNSPVASWNLSSDPLTRQRRVTWGPLETTFAYDSRGRVTKVSQSPGGETLMSIKLEYKGDQIWPSATQYPSGSKFGFTYDASGHLESVLTPSGKEHKYAQTTEFGVANHFYYLPTAHLPFVRSTDSFGRLLALYQPESSRRATFFYQPATSRLERLQFGRISIQFQYDRDSRRPTQILTNFGGNWSLSTASKFQGDLVSETTTRIDLPDSIGSTAAQFSYHYDDLMRVVSIGAVVDDVSLEPLKLAYNPLTGRLSGLNALQFQSAAENKVRLISDRLIVERTFSPTMQPSRELYTVRGRSVCQLQFNYDRLDRLKELTVRLASSDITSERYEYNSDGLLSAAVNGDRFAWAFRYNSDGQTVAINSHQIALDPRGLISGLGEVPYKTDASGYVIGRGADRFDYDSFGRLIRADRRGLAALSFLYDSQGRLVCRVEGQSAVSFFYGFPQHPHLVSHSVERPSGLRTSFSYDTDGRLVVLQRDGRDYFVVATADFSPKFVFSDDGDLVKSVVYSPLGEVVADSNGNFLLPIGFGGNLQDWRIGLIFSRSGRPYDPLSGRWMSLSPEDISLPPSPSDPLRTAGRFDLQPGATPHQPESAGLDVWLSRLGYDLGGLVPQMEDSTAPGRLRLCDPLSRLQIGLECGLERRAAHFRRILSSRPSALLSPSPWSSGRPEVAAGPNPLGAEGIVVANLSGLAAVNIAESVADGRLGDILAVLLNGSAVLPFRFVWDGRSHRHFVKTTADPTRDLAAAGIVGLGANGTAPISPHLNLSLHRTAEGLVDLHIQSRLADVAIFYGRTVEAVASRLLTAALTRGGNLAWLRERSALINSLPTSHNWTEAERAELAQTSRVVGFNPEFSLLDPADAIRLADDSSLFRFVRTDANQLR